MTCAAPAPPARRAAPPPTTWPAWPTTSTPSAARSRPDGRCTSWATTGAGSRAGSSSRGRASPGASPRSPASPGRRSATRSAPPAPRCAAATCGAPLDRVRRSWYIVPLCLPGGPTLMWKVALAGGRWRQMADAGGGADARRRLPGADGVRRRMARGEPVPRQHPAPSVRRNPLAPAHAPVQLIVPTRDRFISASYYDAAARVAPGLRRHEMPGSHGCRAHSPISSPAGWPSSPASRARRCTELRRHIDTRAWKESGRPARNARACCSNIARRGSTPSPCSHAPGWSTSTANRSPYCAGSTPATWTTSSSGPVAHAIRGDQAAKGPVAIVPAPYSRNWDRLTRALVAEHAGLRSDRGLPGSGERGDAVSVKLTPDKLARGRRWMLRFGEFDLDIEGSGARAAGAGAPVTAAPGRTGHPPRAPLPGAALRGQPVRGRRRRQRRGRLPRGPRALLPRAPHGHRAGVQSHAQRRRRGSPDASASRDEAGRAEAARDAGLPTPDRRCPPTSLTA